MAEEQANRGFESKIPVGVSQCLLGENVRYNGGHKLSKLLTKKLSKYFDYHPVCPEVAIGLGIPRAPIRLVATDAGVRARGTVDDSLDVTDALEQYGTERGRAMQHLAGYVFMQSSPSCGVFRVKTYMANGYPSAEGSPGLYAKRFREQQPLLPVEEAGRLNDDGICENFVTRVMVYQQWKTEIEPEPTYKKIVEFYTRHKFLLLAHSQQRYRQLGPLIARAGTLPLPEFAHSVISEIMAILEIVPNRKNNTNVLMHLQGFVKKELPSDDRQELSDLILQYNRGEVPLVVPLVMLRHHIGKVDNDYLHQQSYLDPHPREMGLRNRL